MYFLIIKPHTFLLFWKDWTHSFIISFVYIGLEIFGNKKRGIIMSNFVTNTSHKSRKTALLLCIFGGLLGFHYFYVGRFWKGVLFFCTFVFLLWVGCMISAKFFMADSAISTDPPLLSGKIKTILVMSTKWLH